MTIKVLMIRKLHCLVQVDNTELLPKISSMLTELRTMAFRQPGYISGETMRNVNDPNEYLVISTWKSIEDWERWFANKKREALEGKVDTLMGTETEYRIYSYD